MLRVLIISLLILSCDSSKTDSNSLAQKTAPSPVHTTKRITANSFISTADSIVLISHRSYDHSPPDIKTGKRPSRANLLDNGRLNTSIIHERVRLENEDATNLGRILDQKVTNDIIATTCFDPHHTILAHKGNKISYIDLCFDCNGFGVLNFPFEQSMSYAKYDKLKALFKKQGFTYMID